MPRSASSDRFAGSELFRFVRVRPPRVIDLAHRARKHPKLAAVLAFEPEERRAWAERQLAALGSELDVRGLRFPYLGYMRGRILPSNRLPIRTDLTDPHAFRSEDVRADARYRDDHDLLLLRATALRLAEGAQSKALARAARLLDFVERFPDLPHAVTREPYAHVLLERPELRTGKSTAPTRANAGREPAPGDEPARVAKGLRVLWTARNLFLQEVRREFERARREIERSLPELPPLPQAPPLAKGRGAARAAARRSEEVKERASAHAAALRRRTEELRELRSEFDTVRRNATLERMLTGGSAATIAKYAPGHTAEKVASMMATVMEYGSKYDIPLAKFCQAYETAIAAADAAGTVLTDATPDTSGCFAESPDLAFADTVRILGEADLIRVDEAFVRYTAGEISYVETVLAGEVRKRRVKATRYFEQSTETVTHEETEASKESSGTTRQELKSQVETELSTRLESDVSASANASGGGTIGLVELQGGGTVDASFGAGIDTSLSSNNESQFSQELVSRALERTRRTVAERRLTRSYSLDETQNSHAIRNDFDGAVSFNGVYCFLDRHVAITESVYGRRLFVLANVQTPGRSLLCARLQRLQLAYEDVGARPVFDITPADITPANYMQLAGRFKAQDVAPPPSPVITLGRTFKTDATNTNAEGEEFNGRKIAEVLVPYFSRYKRFLIAEPIRLPDGYEVMEVVVTVNHGANGVSIPADLPIRAGGAMAFAAPALAAYGGYGPFLLPVWLWYVGFLASPVLHYNCDSSNVTIGIGTESQDSPYYFFDPDLLARELFALLGSASAALPGILEQIQAGVGPLMTDLATRAGQVPQQAADAVTEAVNVFITTLRSVFDDLIGGRPQDAVAKLATLGFQITQPQLQNLQNTMGTLFEPFRAFIQQALDLIGGAVGTAIVELFSYFMEVSESSQTFLFSGAQGTRGELPVSFNTIAVKPGITINLSACLRRTDEALARWQLDTFAAFYRAHQQLAAEHESRSFAAGGRAARVARPPSALRAEEHAAIKERVLHALNSVSSVQGNHYTLEAMNFFEHAFDWPNMSYRVFGYGPTAAEAGLEKQGVFVGADERRRAFTSALWAQVMLPVSGDAHFAGQVVRYFSEGTFNFEGELQNDELVALYRDFVLGRDAEPLEVSEPRFEVVPTDFVVLRTPDLDDVLPQNPLFAGG